MLSKIEIERLADALHALRPDWPTKSLVTFTSNVLGDQRYADVAVALVAIAVDPATQTPKRIMADGPWWRAAQAAFGRTPTSIPTGDAERCTEDGHEHELAANCRLCRAAAIAAAGTAVIGITPEQAEINARGAQHVYEALRRIRSTADGAIEAMDATHTTGDNA